MYIKNLWHKIKHWEYWPTWLVYFPFVFLWLIYAIRLRDVFFFLRINPALKNGGFFNISKIEIYKCLPQHLYPTTICIHPSTHTLQQIDAIGRQIGFPIIAKPDKGLRGKGVIYIENNEQLLEMANSYTTSYLLQPFINYPQEAGIFFYLHPIHQKVMVSGIVQKQFFKIVGDGKQSIEALILANPRYAIQLSRLKSTTKLNLKRIPLTDEEVVIEPIGNHNKGTLFFDASCKITEELTLAVNNMLSQSPGINYGRIDIKFNSWEELIKGQHFKIIELNGGLSEPAHIYDPYYAYSKAIKEIYRHFNIMFAICKASPRKHRSWKYVLTEWKLHNKQLNQFDGFVLAQ